jgi:hypothetical protein
MQETYIPGETRASGEPGMTVKVSGEGSMAATGSISPVLSVQADAIFALASAQAGADLALVQTVQLGVSVSGLIPHGVTDAYVELGSLGYSFFATITRYNSNCVVLERHSGFVIGASPHPFGHLSWT